MVRWAGMGFCPPPWHPAMAAARFGAIRAYRCRCFGLGDREQAEVHLGISNAEARIGAVEQTATHRIEVIRTDMSRAHHDHKERTDRLIDQLTARAPHLEAGRAYKTASDRSTPGLLTCRRSKIAFSRSTRQYDSAVISIGPDRPWLSIRLQCCTG
eukprot:s1553_g1.t1